MDFLLKHLTLYQIMYQKVGKKSTSVQLSVLELDYVKEFHKDWFLVPC